MNENETQSAEDKVSAAESTASTSEVAKSTTKKSSKRKYFVSFIVVAVILLGVIYLLEKEGRSSTTIFSSLIESQQANAVVAVVNGENIISSQLDTSIEQFNQVAAIQGIDVTNPDAMVEIRGQALDVLINTQLLKQAAAERGISVTDEEAESRLETIKEDLGGEEVLTERMNELGIGTEQLHQDIKDELLIKELLDQIFLESDISVTEEEVAAVYENAKSAAGDEAVDLPALEEVRAEVEAQILSSKEQAAIDEYLSGLKSEAEIEIPAE